MALFTAKQLKDWLHYADDLVEDEVAQVEQVVTGWLLDALERDVLPEAPLPRTLAAYALELGGIAWENPTTMTSDMTGNQMSVWAVKRRDEILAAVTRWGQRNPTAAFTGGVRPRGCFPPAQPYPDAAPTTVRRRGLWRG